jgi:hypothetical protein
MNSQLPHYGGPHWWCIAHTMGFGHCLTSFSPYFLGSHSSPRYFSHHRNYARRNSSTLQHVAHATRERRYARRLTPTQDTCISRGGPKRKWNLATNRTSSDCFSTLQTYTLSPQPVCLGWRSSTAVNNTHALDSLACASGVD